MDNWVTLRLLAVRCARYRHNTGDRGTPKAVIAGVVILVMLATGLIGMAIYSFTKSSGWFQKPSYQSQMYNTFNNDAFDVAAFDAALPLEDAETRQNSSAPL